MGLNDDSAGTLVFFEAKTTSGRVDDATHQRLASEKKLDAVADSTATAGAEGEAGVHSRPPGRYRRLRQSHKRRHHKRSHPRLRSLDH